MSYTKNYICRLMQANSWHKLFHFHLSFYIWKAWKGKEKLQKFEYLENKKSLLDETPSNYYREGFMREMMSVICVQVKKIVLASETKMVQKRRFRRDFFWPIFLKYMAVLMQNFQVWKLDFILLLSCSQSGACLLVLLDRTMYVYPPNIKM